MCSRYIIEVLLTGGYEELAYDLLTQTTYPSWGFEIGKGATTIWERWEEVVDEDSFLSQMASYNHPMYGAVGVCFYKYLAGIDSCEDGPGFGTATILQNAGDEAVASAEAVLSMITGEDTSSRLIALDGTVIDQENVEEIIEMHNKNNMMN